MNHRQSHEAFEPVAGCPIQNAPFAFWVGKHKARASRSRIRARLQSCRSRVNRKLRALARAERAGAFRPLKGEANRVAFRPGGLVSRHGFGCAGRPRSGRRKVAPGASLGSRSFNPTPQARLSGRKKRHGASGRAGRVPHNRKRMMNGASAPARRFQKQKPRPEKQALRGNP